MKKFAVIAASAAIAVMSAASAIALQGSIMYEWTYYSDASKTTIVGFSIDRCLGEMAVPGPTGGQVTPYFDQYPTGDCAGYGYY